MSEDNLDPAEALDAVRDARAAIADGYSRNTWAYDLPYSALTAAFIAAQAFNSPLNSVFTCISALGLVTLFSYWRDKHGVSVSGLRRGGTRWIAISLGVVMIGFSLGAIVIKERLHIIWPCLVASALVFVVALTASRLWRASFRRDNGLQP